MRANLRTRIVPLTILTLFCLSSVVSVAGEQFEYQEYSCEEDCCYAPHPTCTCGDGSACFGNRITGDWNGLRSGLASNGITFDGDVTFMYQGVADGGLNQTFNYAGHQDYLLRFDLGKMGLQEGLSLQLRAESRWGEILAADAGLIGPAGLHAATPTLATEGLILTNFLFSQVVNENWTFLIGKLDTLEGDRNPFASGRGKTQFMNTDLIEPVLGIPTVPFATLGAGAVYSVDGMPAAQVLVLNATDTTTTSGFDQLFEDGVAIMGGVNVPVPIAGKMGIHSFNGAWNSKTFTSLGQDPRVLTGNAPITKSDESWAVWWSGAQYLHQDPCDPMKGWGLFGRVGTSKSETNPIDFFMNFGIGGQSPIRGRKNDLFGIGWFHNRFSNELGPIATNALGVGSSAQGVEMYYNCAVTPYFHLTPDIQIVEPGQNQADTALILGLRAQFDI